MFHHKSSDHFFKIGKELFNDNENGDILFKAGTETFSAHSYILLHYVQPLAALLCDHCCQAHEKTVIILPDIAPGFIKDALMDLYLKGDSRNLNLIFNADCVQNNQEENVISKKTNNSSGSAGNVKNTMIQKEIARNPVNSDLFPEIS